MKTAYSYVRLSTKIQTRDTATGQTRQLEKAAAICKEKGWTLSNKTFQDLGVSGFKGINRLYGELAEFIKLAKDGKLVEHPVLLLESFDRFSRQDINEAEPAFLDLLKSGVDIHVAHVNKTFTQEQTKELNIRFEILMAIKQAHDFSALLSSRIKSTQTLRDNKINSGQVMLTCNVPRYYKYDETKKTYIQTPKAEVVKRIVNYYLGGYSLYEISKRLNAEAVPCIGYAGTVNWKRNSIKGILQNKALYGVHKLNETFFRNPICDKNTFDRIQVLLKQNSGNRGRFASEYINMFRGIAKCPVCKGGMSIGVEKFSSKTGKAKKEPYRYFRCSSVSNSTPCTNRKNFPMKDFEAEFFAIFLQQDPETMYTKDNDGAKQKEITCIQMELVKISKRIFEFLEMDDMVDMIEMKVKIQQLKCQRDNLNVKLQQLQLGQSAMRVRDENIINFKKLYTALNDSNHVMEFEAGIDSLEAKLKDNELRRKVRDMLPTFVSRIYFDCVITGNWTVYDLNGKHIYTSMPH